MSLPPRIANYHTHCYLCDGADKPVDYVDAARERGFHAIGFTSHAPLPFPVHWVMLAESLGTYQAEMIAAKARGTDIEVYSGLEIDFVPGLIGPDGSTFQEVDLDIVIGSVHFVESPDGEHLPIDGSVDNFANSLERGMKNDVRALVGGYYAHVREMLDTYSFDILGHIDVIRKNNAGNRFFDTSESWYRSEVAATIDAAARNGCIVEINTGGIARGRDVMYPEPWVVEALHGKGVRMMVNTDAHAPEHLGCGYEQAYEMLRKAGYREHWLMTDGKWTGEPI